MLQLFQKLSSLPASNRKQNAVLSALVSCVHKVCQQPSLIHQVPLEMCLSLVQENYDEAQLNQLTLEAALLEQLNARSSLGAMTFLCFLHAGLSLNELEEGLPFRHSVARSTNTSQQSNVVEQFVHLLRSFRAWGIRHLRRFPLGKNLSDMETAERVKFLLLRDALANRLGTFAFDASSVEAILSDIRKLRALAQVTDLDGRAKNSKPTSVDMGSSHAETFLIAFGKARSSPIGHVLVEQDIVHFWTKKEWSTQLQLFHEFQPQLDAESKYVAVDQWYDQLSRTNRFQFESEITKDVPTNGDIAQSQGTSTSNITRVAYADFTGLALPSSVLQHTDTTRPCFIHAGSWQRNSQPAPDRVLYCGRIQYSAMPLLAYDDEERTVLNRKSQELLLKYPDYGDDLRVKRFARELPYASYERWLLQDLANCHAHELDLLCDNLATRERFLSLDPTNYCAIHLSTHGDGDETIPECSRLELAQGASNIISFIDIQSLDWSKSELVFLNTCHGAIGRRSSGEGALSLAWAFSAGGAKAVIAARWSLPDSAAWYFAKCFYESWQFSKADWAIVTAFHDAMEKIRNHPSFSRPSIWGAFTLLHAGEILA